MSIYDVVTAIGATSRELSPGGRPRVVIDRAVELVGSIGSAASSCRLTVESMTVDDDIWRLDHDWSWMRDSWDIKHPDEFSGTKVALRGLEVTEGPGLVVCLTLRLTDWREARSVQELLEMGAYEGLVLPALARLADVGQSIFVNLLSVHCIVETADQHLVVIRRPQTATFHPSRWSASVEEGLEPSDLEAGVELFSQAARRCLSEELVGSRDLSAADMQLMGLVVELPTLNPSAAVYARIPLSRTELAGAIADAPDRGEVSSLNMIPFEPDTMVQVLTSSEVSSSWHPTARYRILAALIQRFGLARIEEAVDGLLVDER